MSHADLPAAVQRRPASALLKGLRRIVGSRHVLQGDEAQRPFECDGLSVYRSLPLLTVLPADAGQVRAVLQLCHRLQVPVVTRGAGTGLSAGALPHPEGVLLVLSRMDRILHIDPDNYSARVEPGVRNLAVSEAVRAHGLFYAPDPSSQIACTIGGNVAENAGGIHCLKYGLTVHNILGLKALTMAGEELHLSPSDNPSGANLMALLTGSEGMLAVVTEITLRLLPRPQATRTLLASFARLEDAAQSVSRIISAGIIPAALEMMDNTALCAAEDYAHAGYPRQAAAILIIELDGQEALVEDELEQLRRVLSDCAVTSLRLAVDEAERERLWTGRKSAFPAVGRISPDYYCMDGTIPRAALPAVLAHITALSTEYGLRVANVFHAGDGNLHPLILFDANVSGELERVEEMGARILEHCIAVGGTITGEHGVGLEKIRQMAVQFNDPELALFHRVKAACDPQGLLNPGKHIPQLKHCQEYRALSVNRVPDIASKPSRAAVSTAEEKAVTHLQEALADARSEQRLICIDGNQSKAFLGHALEGEVLSTRQHRGVLHYDPAELLLQARAGTALSEINSLLAEHGQHLACDPPHFGKASLGGMVASGLAGPGRVAGGSVADHVLGCRILAGNGEILRFGGSVMKNVAGYDVSRLLVGSMGTLGILLDVTLRVMPRPAHDCSFSVDIASDKMSSLLRRLLQAGFPVSASCHDGQQLRLRLSGSRNALADVEQRLQRELSFVSLRALPAAEEHWWDDLREQRLPFFSQPRNLWRVLLPPATPPLLLSGDWLHEWHGGLRWLASDAAPEEVFAQAAAQGGQAMLFRPEYSRATQAPRVAALQGAHSTWYRHLKQVFDPDDIMNIGRLYPEH